MKFIHKMAIVLMAFAFVAAFATDSIELADEAYARSVTSWV